MSARLIAGDVNLGHLVKVLSAGFLHCKVTVFLFVVDRYLGGGTLRVYLFLLRLPPANLGTHW